MKHVLVALCAIGLLAACSSDASDVGDENTDITNFQGDTTDGDTPLCQPNCTDRVCGSDGCDGVCGTCGDTEACEAGQCVLDPSSSCAGICGAFVASANCMCDANCFNNDDCCSDICDVCMDHAAIAPRCEPECTPECAPGSCDDGCGGDCGGCLGGSTCVDGACVADTPECDPPCVDGETCVDGACVADTPECDPPCVDGESCVDGTCVEGPEPATSCEGTCGVFNGEGVCNCDADCFDFDDCCDDICDTCAVDYADQCTVDCDPACADGETCVDGVCEEETVTGDSCEGLCGIFNGDDTCNCDTLCWEFEDCCEDICDTCADDFVEECEPACVPTCADDQECGDDGCDGVCGAGCADGTICGDDNICACMPTCADDQECGDDGCGGLCGAGCADGTTCGEDNLCAAVDCFGVDAEEVCPEDTACVLTWGWDGLMCYPDQGEGDACGWGIGDCADGLTCVWDDDSYTSRTCQPATAATGEDCGYALPACADGWTCDWVLPGEGQCLEYQQEGDPCGLGKGTCADELDCWEETSDGGDALCYPKKNIGQACAWGEGSCDEKLWCMWDEEPDADGVPHCYPATILDGQTCGTGWGGCEAWHSCVPVDDTGVDSTCMIIGLPGDDCGPGIGECAGGLGECTLLTTDGDETQCMKFQWPGDTCGVGIGPCMGGLVCVPSDSDPEVGICQDQCVFYDWYDDGECDTDCWGQDIDCFCIPSCDGLNCGDDGCGGTCGSPCSASETCDAGVCTAVDCGSDWDICGDGSDCVFLPDYTSMVCMDQAAEGESCAFGDPACADGLVCSGQAPGNGVYACTGETAEVGEDCGFGDPLCVDGASCLWIDFELTSCAADLNLGDECLSAEAACPEGTECVWTSQAEDAAVCMAEQAIGDPCYWGAGPCADGSTCQWDATQTEPLCFADDGGAGDVCGAPGTGGCEDMLACTLPDVDAASGTCEAIAFAGESCGYGVAYCFAAASCIQTAPGGADLACFLNGWIGDLCGPGVAGCNTGLECIYDGADPDVGTCKDSCDFYGTYMDGVCDQGCLILDGDCLDG
jgi:hypothetical protein